MHVSIPGDSCCAGRAAVAQCAACSPATGVLRQVASLAVKRTGTTSRRRPAARSGLPVELGHGTRYDRTMIAAAVAWMYRPNNGSSSTGAVDSGIELNP